MIKLYQNILLPCILQHSIIAVISNNYYGSINHFTVFISLLALWLLRVLMFLKNLMPAKTAGDSNIRRLRTLTKKNKNNDLQ